MSRCDRLDDRQPKPSPTTSGAARSSLKWLEQPADIPRIDDVTVVRHSEIGISLSHLDYDIDNAAVLVVTDRIVEQVCHKAFGQIPTAERTSCREGAVDPHSSALGRVRLTRDGSGDYILHIERSGVRKPMSRPGECEQRVDEPLLLLASGDSPLQGASE